MQISAAITATQDAIWRERNWGQGEEGDKDSQSHKHLALNAGLIRISHLSHGKVEPLFPYFQCISVDFVQSSIVHILMRISAIVSLFITYIIVICKKRHSTLSCEKCIKYSDYQKNILSRSCHLGNHHILSGLYSTRDKSILLLEYIQQIDSLAAFCAGSAFFAESSAPLILYLCQFAQSGQKKIQKHPRIVNR